MAGRMNGQMGGLLDRDLEIIQESLRRLPEIECAILFGSRALGNFKQGSDVDLAIVGDAISQQTLVELNEWLNEIYPLPYMFDLHHYDSITNENLKHHIDVFGQQIYRRFNESG